MSEIPPEPVPDDAPIPPSPVEETSLAPESASETVQEPPPASRELSPAEVRENNREVEREMSRISRRSFLWAGAGVAAGFIGWRWLTTRREDNGVVWPLRRSLEINEQWARDYFQPSRLAPTFSPTLAGMPKVNGTDGLSDDFDPAEWQLRVEGLAQIPKGVTVEDKNADQPVLLLTLKEIQALPRVEMVTELKCIEGWSKVVHWAGARLVDFAAKYPPATLSGDPPDVLRKPDDLPQYVSLVTPDGGYYVGLDRDSALHPQTLLCYEMDGQPLTLDHGAPLRLAIPVKYGIKNLKRIGTLKFTNERPADFWAEQGYDWYSGH